MQDFHKSPVETISSPSYADALKKKAVESSSFSEDDEQFTKKVGIKSQKEIREQESERLKMQGSQMTIEMSYGRSKWNMTLKGGTTPFSLGK